jgi:hypothetical protein
MKTLKVGSLYFLLVFGTGFVLGTIRTLWLVPKVGTRTAELIETPLMFMAIIFVAKWMARRFSLRLTPGSGLSVGLIALALLLVAELAVVFWLRRVTIGDYLASRDPVAGTVYVVMLGVFAVMPVIVARR